MLLKLSLIYIFRSNNPKKVRSLKVLEPKASQNLSILLGGSLKHLSYADVKRGVLRCDDTILKGNVLDQLINYLPPQDQLKKLTDLNCGYENLVESEQFAVTVCIIVNFYLKFILYMFIFSDGRY